MPDDVAQWSAFDWLTAIGGALGAVCFIEDRVRCWRRHWGRGA
jgi:hypothetical protein